MLRVSNSRGNNADDHMPFCMYFFDNRHVIYCLMKSLEFNYKYMLVVSGN